MADWTERRVRPRFLLVAFSLLIVGLFCFAIWEIAQNKRAAAEIARFFGALLAGSVVFVIIFFPEIWFGPLMAWLERRAPDWLYRTVIWILVGLGVIGLAILARTAFVYVAGFLT